ncbi:MAG: hypothetical protein A2583_15525 [Bdellovibrionales bacterium RIFOXYD1_FULL_53_11]|nr:MAG: hypothetical protein A2583_15525 [Bdellovibrionales bacterium RIFOXYD1_FULL_53_11]
MGFNVGIAMALGGTEVAREAADMVLTDDNFASIAAAVEEGRGVFDNLQKFIVWTLPTNMGEALVLIIAILLGLTLPILPVQILWVNMMTAVLLGMTLAFEPKERGIMARPPQPAGYAASQRCIGWPSAARCCTYDRKRLRDFPLDAESGGFIAGSQDRSGGDDRAH